MQKYFGGRVGGWGHNSVPRSLLYMLLFISCFFSLNSKYILASFHHWKFSLFLQLQNTLSTHHSLFNQSHTDGHLVFQFFCITKDTAKNYFVLHLFAFLSLDLRQIPRNEIAGSKGKFISFHQLSKCILNP